MTQAAKKVLGVTTGGPMPQGLFLESMGLNTRLEVMDFRIL